VPFPIWCNCFHCNCRVLPQKCVDARERGRTHTRARARAHTHTLLACLYSFMFHHVWYLHFKIIHVRLYIHTESKDRVTFSIHPKFVNLCYTHCFWCHPSIHQKYRKLKEFNRQFIAWILTAELTGMLQVAYVQFRSTEILKFYSIWHQYSPYYTHQDLF
jgi:hypothetical protein